MKKKSLALLFLFIVIWFVKLEALESDSLNSSATNSDAEEDKAGTTASRRPAAAPAPSPGTSAEAATSISALRAGIERNEACHASRNCPFPKNDPREYDLAIDRSTASLVQAFAMGVKQRQEISPAISSLAQELVQSSDGHIKAAALELISSQEPNPNALLAIFSGVLRAHDAGLVPAAFSEFQRYQSPEAEVEIADSVIETLRTGSINVALACAENLRMVLAENTLPRYQRFMSELPADSRLRRIIESAILAFQRERSGG